MDDLGIGNRRGRAALGEDRLHPINASGIGFGRMTRQICQEAPALL